MYNLSYTNSQNDNNNNQGSSSSRNNEVELPLLEMNDLSLIEPSSSSSQIIRIPTIRNYGQSQHRFYKKSIRPRLLQQKNSREKKFPYTTMKKSNGIRKNQALLKYSKLIDYGLAEQLEGISINKNNQKSSLLSSLNNLNILNLGAPSNKYLDLKYDLSSKYPHQRNILSIPKAPTHILLNELDKAMISQREFKFDNVLNDWKFVINSLGISGDSNLLKIFTLGTRFSDLIHKIQTEKNNKTMYIPNMKPNKYQINSSALESLTNQSIGINNMDN